MKIENKYISLDYSWANNKVKERKLSKHNNYYVNLDHKYFNNLTRKQIAFIFLIEKLNKANLIASNKEIEAAIGVRFDGVHDLYQNINNKYPGLVIVTYEKVNKFGRVVSGDNQNSQLKRVIRLSRPLHIKGETYINLPSFASEKRSCFLSSTELQVLGYLKAFQDNPFRGYLKTITSKLGISYGRLRRSLLKLAKIKAILKKAIPIRQKIKNIYYTVNTISFNTNWSYYYDKSDTTNRVRQKIPNDIESEDTWDELMLSIGEL